MRLPTYAVSSLIFLQTTSVLAMMSGSPEAPRYPVGSFLASTTKEPVLAEALSNSLVRLDLENKRTESIERIQDILLTVLNIARSRVIDLKAVATLLEDDSEEGKQFSNELVLSHLELLQFSRAKTLAVIRSDNDLNLKLWTFLVHSTTELLLKTDELNSKNSFDWLAALGELAMDSKSIADLANGDIWRAAKPIQFDDDIDAETKLMREKLKAEASLHGADEKHWSAIQARNFSDYDQTVIRNERGEARQVDSDNAYQRYTLVERNEWLIVSQYLQRISAEIGAPVRLLGRTDQIRNKCNELTETKLRLFSLAEKQHNTTHAGHKKTNERLVQIKEANLLKLTQEIETLIQARKIDLGKKKSEENPWLVGMVTHKSRQKPKTSQKKKKRSNALKQTPASPLETSHPEQVSKSRSEQFPDNQAEKAPEQVTLQESGSISEFKPKPSKANQVSMQNAKLYRDSVNQYRNAKAMKRKLALEAFKAEQSNKNSQHQRRFARMFTEIKLEAQEYEIYDRLLNPIGRGLPTWSEFTWLMKQIYEHTGGKTIGKGNGSSFTFVVGTRSFNVHKPANDRDSIPYKYNTGFIQPGLEYVGLTSDVVVAK